MNAPSKKPVLIHATDKRQVHHAGWVVADSNTIIPSGYIEVENKKIIRISKTPLPGEVIDHGPGILMPPLVNAHTHLELSALKNQLPFDKGFKTWVNALIEKRELLGEQFLKEQAKRTVNSLLADGVAYVGDISTLNITQDILKNSLLRGVCFNEYLGDQLPEVEIQKEGPFSVSLAGHAPHSSSPELLKALKEKTRTKGLPFSIHVAESEDESEFIKNKKGQWADFLTLRGIDGSSWDIGGETPVEHLGYLKILDKDTLVVHLLTASGSDLQVVAQSMAKVVVCPRSNLNLHGKLPDIEAMIAYDIHPALGTDSLASCNSLSVFDEMAFVREQYPDLSDQTIFSMGTINGARALGVEKDAGTLATGKSGDLLYLPARINGQKDIFKEIVTNE